MYLRFTRRNKDGKAHRYWSVVESRRCAGGRVVQIGIERLDGDVTVQALVTGAIDRAHAAAADPLEDFVFSDVLANQRLQGLDRRSSGRSSRSPHSFQEPV